MQRFVVREQSMAPALIDGDHLLAWSSSPKPGRVAVFPNPLDTKMWLVKRIVAVGGDTVRQDGDRLSIKGPRDSTERKVPASQRSMTWTLAEDEMFMLSDDPMVTRFDSRLFGPVSIDGAEIVRLRYRPLARLAIL